MGQEDIKKPNLNDYMAGALLSNGVIWIWVMAANLIQPNMPLENSFILGLITFIVFICAGAVASYLVSKRSSFNHFKVLLKLVATELVFSIIFILSFVNPSIELVAVLFFSFIVGGLAGVYLAVRGRSIREVAGRNEAKA